MITNLIESADHVNQLRGKPVKAFAEDIFGHLADGRRDTTGNGSLCIGIATE